MNAEHIYRPTSVLVLFFLIALFGSVAAAPPADTPPASPPPAQAESAPPTEMTTPSETGDVLERGVSPRVLRPGLSPQVLTPLQTAPLLVSALPGHFAIQTFRGNYLTAVDGGGRISNAVHTDARQIGAWEKFRLLRGAGSGQLSIQASRGNYVTAVNGGGLTLDALHTDAIQIAAWEQFRLIPDQYGWRHAIQTVNGHYLTAVGAGGKAVDAIHADALKVGNWEEFYIWKCGDLGTGHQYTINAVSDPNGFVFAYGGGGRVNTRDDVFIFGALGVLSDYKKHPIPFDNNWQRFRLLRQGDGSYALQTSNGVNYVTAVKGGGQASGGITWDSLVTDRTQVQAWEQFRFVEQGNCTYAIQTSSGHYLGKKTATTGIGKFATNISDINQATKFRLGMVF